MAFDRTAEDVGNLLRMEHVNIAVPDPLVATQFYVSALGLTRDPYLVTGVDNMWINAGRTQFHLPTNTAQLLRATIDLVIPGRQALLDRLRAAASSLAASAFSFEALADHVAVRCPWGNRLRCFEPDEARFGATKLGIARLNFEVPVGSAAGIAAFYREVFAAPASLSRGDGDVPVACVRTGMGQSLRFSETTRDLPPYDGHHIQIYVADFSGPHRRLQALGAVSEESNQHQYRFLDIVDPGSAAPLFRIEHEVRSATHPMFGRTLVNRNSQQTSRNYRPGEDAFHAA